jgi:hypothetical protein
VSTADAAAIGDKVIELRSAGKSFASIATEVGVERKVDALRLFLEAIDTRPAEEQVALREAENKRLDALERKTRKQDDEAARERGLASIVKLRDYIAGTKSAKKPAAKSGKK